MKTVCAAIAVAVAGGFILGTWGSPAGGHAVALAAQETGSSVSLEQAMRVALEKVPGRVHEIDLLEKPGKVNWLVEILSPEGRMVRVEVDSESGLVGTVSEPRAVHILGDPDKGRRVYENLCISCHGPEGHGDGPFGPHLVPPAEDFWSQDFKMTPDIDVFNAIKKGRPGTAMQGFEQRLTSQQIRDVLAYVRSLGT